MVPRSNKKKQRSLTDHSVHWSDKQKTEAIQSYLLLGNLSLTGRVLGIPEITLRKWKATPWWQEQIHELRTQERIELSARLKKIVNAAQTVVEDRLVNGNFQMDQKSGEVIRIPVNMKDAHKVAVDLMERQELMEKTEKPELTDEGIDDKLLKLANKFADMATKRIEQKELEHRTVDVEDVIEILKDN